MGAQCPPRVVDEVEQVRQALRREAPASSASAAAWELGPLEGSHGHRRATLVIGATHDTMDRTHMRSMADQLPHGTYLHCPDAMGRGPIDAGERPDRRRRAALLRGSSPRPASVRPPESPVQPAGSYCCSCNPALRASAERSSASLTNVESATRLADSARVEAKPRW